jgi:type I restriction enzyme M protein
VLDSDTRRKIDTLRDILVGKIPNPQTQVEQITTGLIYKFMDDMDQESIEMGGEGSFFVGDYEKYAWKNLLDPKLSGVDKVNLYSQAIEGMYLNPSAPQLFRDIFKNAFLPFKDPSTLNMFLKEINEFHYSHSEKLGDAFEYLISIMGSQGDAGQFRTPRHIIDFIVEIVNPQKNETILDPACGTAGFLISSYKHILKTNTDKKLGDKLSAEDKKRVGENVTGYDISPEMIRLSLVNMYLHGFSTPKIDEYDTLSSEDNWNEYFDVILANPPFFSPKGGIQPHKRFGVQSTKAEVLFTSYILEHLKPNGRAGIIIPEGIIFQTGKAYNELRKQLIENGLVGVISLPSGVFQPYSGVKTSILILDKKLNKERDSVFFAEVKNDGFDLGAQRNQIEKNDLPELCLKIKEYDDSIFKVSKLKLLQSKDYSFSSNKYKEVDLISSTFDLVNIKDHAEFKRGTSKSKKDLIEGKIPVIAGGMQPAYYCNESNRDENIITLSSSGANAGFVNFYTEKIFATDCFTIESNPNSLDQKFLFRMLKGRQEDIFNMQTGGAQPHVYARDFDNYIIPLPPLEVQQEIVDELEGYQKIIDGCKQVVENYKPTIDIDPSWEMIELGEIGEIISGGTPKSDEKSYWNGEIKWLTLVDLPADESISYITNSKRKITELGLSKSSAKMIPIRSVIVSSRATIGRVGINEVEVSTNQGFKSIVIDETKHLTEYIAVQIFLKRKYMQEIATGGTFGEINKTNFMKIKIPIPSIDSQKEIVQKIEEERIVIEGNKKLIETYTQKIQNRINKVWGEE